jgi:hypothetical protein
MLSVYEREVRKVSALPDRCVAVGAIPWRGRATERV